MIRPLASLFAITAALVTLPGTAVAGGHADILAKADIGYGEYLSGECVTCHHQKGAEEGIPNIRGLDPETFITVLLAYRNGDIDHDAMELIAGRLDDEQVASLAVYFASLPGPE